MSLEFIPTIWANTLLELATKEFVYAQPGVCNRDYEDQLREKGGDTLNIGSIGSVTVEDYTVDTDVDDPESLTDEETTLLVDQAKYFNFFIDSVTAERSPVYRDGKNAMTTASTALASIADVYVAGLMDTAVPSGNRIGSTGSPIVPTTANAYEYLVDLAAKLDAANCPQEDRWCVVPPWFWGFMEKDTSGRIPNTGSKAYQGTLKGEAMFSAGMRILKSNNVPNTAGEKYKIIAGHPRATTFADQLTQIVRYIPEKRFGIGIKGLHVYGAKVLLPGFLAEIVASPA